MRKTGICPKCSHNRLIHVGSVADTGSTQYHSHIEDMHLAVLVTGIGFFGDEKRESVGKLSAIMCRRCGFTELYVLDPESVQPDGKYITELAGPPPAAPYR